MPDDQLVELFLDGGFVWPHRRDATVQIRLARLTQAEASAVAGRFGGRPYFWKYDGTWFWQAQGKRAMAVLLAVAPYVALRPQRREAKTEGDNQP